MGKVKNIPETATELRTDLIERINQMEDIQDLMRIYQYLQEEEMKRTIVGYRIGTRDPITAWEFQQEADRISSEMDEGKYHTIEEAKERFGI